MVLSQLVLTEADVSIGHLLIGLRIVVDVLLVAADGFGVDSLPKVLVSLFLQTHNYITQSTVQPSIIESVAFRLARKVLLGEGMVIGVQTILLYLFYSQRGGGNVVEGELLHVEGLHPFEKLSLYQLLDVYGIAVALDSSGFF